ncbi:hypothetical protein GPL15_11265 [Clostridium sp. MCC353]|uniref:O-antigen ligase family protein n=1 Tax=Clostridium sp. MCC353 TaxID=2592646 RepID=UPI001C0398C2|nr:O-antigen ligase family protein [Clostridium sp. MCC353]MBT9777081.1 hypothetical protein [Clostridium sp. MCC353]
MKRQVNCTLKIKIDDIMLFLMFAGLNRVFWNEASVTTRVRLYICVILTSYLLLKNCLKYIKEQASSLPFIFTILISGIINYGIDKDLLGTIIVCTFIFDLFGITSRYARRFGVKALMDKVYYFSLVFLLVNDASVLYAGRLTSSISSDQAAVMYFSGNKFAVVFLHMIYTFLFCCYQDEKLNNNWEARIKFIFLGVYNIFFCLYMNCGTGLIGCILIMILIFFKKNLKYFICKPITFVISLIALNYLFIGTNMLLANSVIQKFVLMIGKDLTLTGRIAIYPQLTYIIRESILIGYGDSSQVVMRVVGYGNAQNGIFHILIQYGAIGALAFIYLCYQTILNAKRKNVDYAYPIFAYIISMVVCSLVEICFSYNFLFAIALLNVIGVYYTKQENV